MHSFGLLARMAVLTPVGLSKGIENTESALRTRYSRLLLPMVRTNLALSRDPCARRLQSPVVDCQARAII